MAGPITQQELFAPKPSDEGPWCVAVYENGHWRSVSRDHRWMTAEAANEWAQSTPPEIMDRQWRVCLTEELGND